MPEIPGKIIKVYQNKALAQIKGEEKEINVSAVKSIKPGDWVLVTSSVAMEKIDEDKAKALLKYFE